MSANQTPAPQWQEFQTVGIHNADLQASAARIVEGKGWLKTDTVIVMPAAKMVPMKCALTWMNMIRPPNQSCPPIWASGMEVGDAYSQVIQQVVDHPQLGAHKYILTIEHDQTVPQDGLLTLIKHAETHPEFAAISGLYWTKGPGGVPQIWGDVKDPLINYRPQPPRVDGGLVECNGLGMGFCLFRMDLFRDQRLRRPWFRTVASTTEGVGTQDLYFWGDARAKGHRCAVACDVLVGHHDSNENKTW